MSTRNLPQRLLRIGEIARRSGVSAKAVRLYEQRGLLVPSSHSPSGYRLYGPESLRRLMQIVVLKRMGLGLADIGRLLHRDVALARQLLATRIDAQERELAERRKALAALRRVASRLDEAVDLDLDQLLESIHMTTELKLELSDQDRALVRERLAAIGGERVEQLRKALPALLEALRTAMQAGTPANDPSVVQLASRYRAIAPELPKVDAATRQRMREALGAREDILAASGLDPALYTYLCAAVAVARERGN